MRILIIDDNGGIMQSYAARAACILRDNSIDADALLPEGLDDDGVPSFLLMQDDGSFSYSPRQSLESILDVVRAADVIFIDHNMPEMKGDEMLDWFRSQGIDLDSKRLVSCSVEHQPYLEEHFCELTYIESTKKFLGLSTD